MYHKSKGRINMILLSTMLSCIAFSPASSRIWKATPNAIAGDYANIQDNRVKGEAVVLRWIAPPTLPAEGSPVFKAVLERYVVILAFHGKFQSSGEASFDDIDTLEARDQSDKPLKFVSSDTLTPAAAGALTAMEAVIRQSLGAMGKAMKTFVFDAGAVRSCEKGGLSVLFAGETYTWETPFPGCTNAVTTDRLTPVAATAPAAPAAPKTIDSSFTVAADKTIQLAFLYSINPDCTSIGFATVRVVEQPKHGKITIENGTGFTSFPTSNPRAECNKRRSDGVTVIYQPEPGYTGTDSLDFDAVLASGTVNRRHYTIDVR